MKLSASILVILFFASYSHVLADAPPSVNATDAPETTVYTSDEIGWFITLPNPGTTYTVTDLGTVFGTSSSQTVTAEIFTNLPRFGGTLLGSGTMTPTVADTATYADFSSPVTLTGGDSYFIAFQNVEDLGMNVTATTGAQGLGHGYTDSTDDNVFGTVGTNINHPILDFGSSSQLAVPEPSTWAMLLGGSVALFAIQRVRRQRQA